MSKLFRTIFLVSLAYILFHIISIFLFSQFEIKIIPQILANVLDILKVFGLPIAILLTLFGTLKLANSGILIFFKIIGTFFLAFAIFVATLILFFNSDDCHWKNIKNAYKHKFKLNRTIVLRKENCIYKDSDDPINLKYFESRTYFNTFRYYKPIDSTTLNLAIWLKTDENLNLDY